MLTLKRPLPARRFLRRGAGPQRPDDAEVLAVVPEIGEVPYDEVLKELTVRFVTAILPYAGDFGCGLTAVTASRIRAIALVDEALRRDVLAMRVEPAAHRLSEMPRPRLIAGLARILRRPLVG